MTLSGKRSVYWIVKELVVISQVNRVRTRDLDCCLTVPLIMEAGDSLELVISRNPLAAADAELPNDCDDPSNSLFCFPNHRNNIVALWPQREILTLQCRRPLLNTHTHTHHVVKPVTLYLSDTPSHSFSALSAHPQTRPLSSPESITLSHKVTSACVHNCQF